MYYKIVNDTIVASYSAGTVHLYIPEADEHVHRDNFHLYGIFLATREEVTLGENQYISGFTASVVNGLPVETPVVVTMTAQEVADQLAHWRAGATASRYQIKEYLRTVNKLADIKTYIQNADEATQLYWTECDKIHRNAAQVEALRVALGFTPGQVDAAFKTQPS